MLSGLLEVYGESSGRRPSLEQSPDKLCCGVYRFQPGCIGSCREHLLHFPRVRLSAAAPFQLTRRHTNSLWGPEIQILGGAFVWSHSLLYCRQMKKHGFQILSPVLKHTVDLILPFHHTAPTPCCGLRDKLRQFSLECMHS